MGRLDTAITSIVDVFLEHAGEEGKKCQLNKEELKKLLQNEIDSTELKGKISAEDIDDAITEMDRNHDGEVNFREFCRCVCGLAKSYYRVKTGKGSRKGKGKEEGQKD